MGGPLAALLLGCLLAAGLAWRVEATSSSFAPFWNGAAPVQPIYGLTFDSISQANEVTTLKNIAHRPTTRIVFDTGETASYYATPILAFHPYSNIMGELIDSSYMTSYTATTAQTWSQNFATALGGSVDIWEIGNEVNGNWLSTLTNDSAAQAEVLSKIEAQYFGVGNEISAPVRALTFFYEGEPSDPNNCIATDHGGNDMFTWIEQVFQTNLAPSARPAETEEMRLGLNYVLISWYPSECPGEVPNWPWVYNNLASIFPNAKVGFGELGTPTSQGGSAYEIAEIQQYYPMAKSVAGLPSSYIGGYFWWYAAEEMVPWNKTALCATLNQSIQ